MSRWSAVSADDYFDALNGPYDWIERTCEACGRPVSVSRREPYTLTVTCDQCQRAAQRVPHGRKGKA